MASEQKSAPQIPLEEFKFPTKPNPDRPHTNRGVLIALIFVLAAILIALIVWFLTLQQTPVEPVVTTTRPSATENDEPESSTEEARTQAQSVTSPSTELSSIETDLNGTQEIDLDPLFADIEALFE